MQQLNAKVVIGILVTVAFSVEGLDGLMPDCGYLHA